MKFVPWTVHLKSLTLSNLLMLELLYYNIFLNWVHTFVQACKLYQLHTSKAYET